MPKGDTIILKLPIINGKQLVHQPMAEGTQEPSKDGFWKHLMGLATVLRNQVLTGKDDTMK